MEIKRSALPGRSQREERAPKGKKPQVSVPWIGSLRNFKYFWVGLENDSVKKNYIEAARIDQQEGLLRGTDDIGTRIIGHPLMTIEEFINENRPLLS